MLEVLSGGIVVVLRGKMVEGVMAVTTCTES